MHEEPLHLIPAAVPRRCAARAESKAAARTITGSTSTGELCPFCRFMYYRAAEEIRRRLDPRDRRMSA